MAGTLTQEEINALLSSVSAGESIEPDKVSIDIQSNERRIRIYNFRHPDKFSKSHLSTMELVYEGFARHLKTALFVYVRQNINFSLASVEQQSFEEYVESLSIPSSLITFKMKNLPGSSILEISPELTFLILDKLLGGAGDQPIKVRELTEIEQMIMRRVAERIIMALRTAWSEIYDIEPTLELFEQNPQLLQIVPSNEIVAVATLEVRIGEAIGAMSICLPYITLEPLIPKLTRQTWFSGKFEHKETDKDEHVKISESIGKAKVPVSVELGTTKLSVRDLIQLKPGDSIRVDTLLNSDVKVLVNKRVKFFAQPGTVGNKLAVKTSRVAN